MVVRLEGSGKMTGNIKARMGGYGAWDVETSMKYADPTERSRTLNQLFARGSNKFKAVGGGYLTNPDKTLSMFTDFELADYIREVGKERYVNLNLERDLATAIDTTGRTVGISFRYKNVIRRVVKLEVPEGYTIEYLPPNERAASGSILNYSITYEKQGKDVILVKEIAVDTLVVAPNQFGAYNDAVRKLNNLYKESIVLTKK
jgi:hypothetical protein